MDTTIDLPPEFTAPPLSRPLDGVVPGYADEHAVTGDKHEFIGGAANDGASGRGGEGADPGVSGPTVPPGRSPVSAAKKSRRQGFLFATTAILVVAVSAGVILHKPLLATIARLRHESVATPGSIKLPKAHNSASVLNHPTTGKTPLNTAIPGLSVSPMFGKPSAGSTATPKKQSMPAPLKPKSQLATTQSTTTAAGNRASGIIGTSAPGIAPAAGSEIGQLSAAANPVAASTDPQGVGIDNPAATSHADADTAPDLRAMASGTDEKATPVSATIVPPSPLVGPVPPAGTIQSIAHPVKVATQLIAAPASRTYEVKTMSLVAALARLVAELRSQNAAMQTEIFTLRHHVDQEMMTFNQRLTFDQAHDALALAGASDPAAQAKRPLPVHSAQIFPTAAPHVPPVSPASYGIQAASPGLAMLIRHGVTYEVSVGSVVPGVGRVISIVQYGSGWIVTTDHGVIR
ncbi:hypothetical protein AruPA_20185 [Acidiphilium sp. PA]|uniref:hypothetical protein n=1 Tax=Acidiphilium sp. PA TaxID=2871705 RepID=UPI002244D054|nr:hypothetical protein [Acidiphilium sp. PA]MCW8309345.1 hypothetical protein [Acidiphilium sp. PA]